MTANNRLARYAITALSVVTISIPISARANELGSPGGGEAMPGIILGASAGVPPPGVYMFNQVLTTPQSIVGPGAPNAAGGPPTKLRLAAEATGFLWVPGWTFLGATYDAVIVQPVSMLYVTSPVNVSKSGFPNTYVVPGELSWKLGDSGFFVKAGLGMFVPDGTISGSNGLGSPGNPWWTFYPELLVSYLKDGWNLTAAFSAEFNTRSTVTGYKSGDVLHAEFTATKSFGKWTFGPVGYYAGQVSDDTSSAFYQGAINVNRYNIWAAGALVGYNFGPATLNVWAVNEFSASASGGSSTPFSVDGASITKGYKVFASLSFRLWAPDDSEAPKRLRSYK